MGLLDFFKAKQASSNFPEDRYFSTLLRSLNQVFAVKSKSNVVVNPDTGMQISAYYCAVRAISEDIAKLPFRAWTVNPVTKDKKPIVDNPVLNVMTQGFNPNLNSSRGTELMVQWMLTWGNAYFEIARDNTTGAIQLYPIHPSRVQPYREKPGDLLSYYVSTEDQMSQNRLRSVRLDNSQVLHIRGLGNEDIGYSVGELAAQSTGITISAQDYTSRFFRNDLNVGSVLTTDKALNAEQKDQMREHWMKKFGGSSAESNIAILDRNFKYETMSMKSTDAELLNTKKFQVTEIARWFRIPPHKLMDMTQAKFSNLEQNDLNYITDTLTPWIHRIEAELKFKFNRTDNTYFDIDEKGLARGDMAARTAYYRELFAMGSINAETIAKLEGLPAPDQGEKYYIPLNMAPVDVTIERQELENEQKRKDIEEPEPEPAEPPAPIEEPEPEDPEEAEEQRSAIDEQAAISIYMPCMIDSLKRLTRKEQLSHEAASKKDAIGMKEHLDKFYIKFEKELADCLEIHAKYLTAVTSKEMFTADKLLFMAKDICQWSKADNQAELISAYLIDEVAQVEDLPKLGEIRQDDEGNSFTYTMKGWVEVDVIKK